MLESQIQTIRNKVVETLKTYFLEDAQEVLTEIDELKKNPEVSNDDAKIEELKVYKALMSFIAFSILPEKEQLELFRSFLVKAFKVGVDVPNRFAIKMNLTPDVLWPETVQAFVEAMLKNDEKLSSRTIVIHGEKGDVSPTLSNWLRDYNRIYGMDRHEKIVPYNYLTTNENVRFLNQEEKVLLLKILEFYEGLKFPSQNQIQGALEKALDQYIEENGSVPEDPAVSEEEVVLSRVKHQLNIGSSDYLDESVDKLIKKFPKVADQLVCGWPIRLIFNGEQVQPTVSNWLADYRAYAGAGPHEINERSDYLIRSPNVQDLSVAERECLGLLLRSYDEQYPLPFSISRQEILFDRVVANV